MVRRWKGGTVRTGLDPPFTSDGSLEVVSEENVNIIFNLGRIK